MLLEGQQSNNIVKCADTLILYTTEDFISEFHKLGCATMMDWLREYNLADVIPSVKALDILDYPDEINMLKDVVTIPGIPMTYILNKVLDMGGDLYSLG